MTKKHYKQMTEEEWKRIKALFAYGVPFSQVEKVTSRAAGTLARIKESGSFAEYQTSTRAYGEKYKSAKTAGQMQTQAPEPVEEPTLTDVVREIRELKAMLAKKKVLL